ncbi:MAG: DUF4274 domain-containing protein [bacterium]|nr:DUF4274 domain-containing protein [bacterium]
MEFGTREKDIYSVRNKSMELLLDWPEGQSPDEWYCIAMSWNWDSGIEPLNWIIMQKQCDRATASLIF